MEKIKKIKEVLINLKNKITPRVLKGSVGLYSLIVGIVLFFTSSLVSNILGSLILIILGSLLITEVIFNHINLPFNVINTALLIIFGVITIFSNPSLLIITYVLFAEIIYCNIIYKEYNK